LNRRKFLAVSGGALSAGVASIGTISLATTEVLETSAGRDHSGGSTDGWGE